MSYHTFIQHLRDKLEYDTPPGSRWPIVSLPGIRILFFYTIFGYTVFATVWRILRGMSAQESVLRSSYLEIRGLERVGGMFHIRGLRHVAEADGAVVITANHMSSIETIVLPCLVMPFRPCTFVVKDSLIRYPLFGRILSELRAIPVTRLNPRQDLQRVLSMGKELLLDGISLVIFPQSTRMIEFDSSKFSSLGCKLARSADVKLIPVALKTDMMTKGRVIKDIGSLDPSKPVHIEFGGPLAITVKGHEEHLRVVGFIEGCLSEWRQS